MKRQTIIALKAIIYFSLLTGVAYPLLVTGIAQLAFAEKANGSIVMEKGTPVGSLLIAQPFSSDKYFWPRPSAIDYNSEMSGASNLGPTNATLREKVKERRMAFIQKNGLAPSAKIPAEMITASASGLDPHISPQAALLQLDRVAKARHYTEEQRQEAAKLIKQLSVENNQLTLGKARVNVFELNLKINQIK